MRYCLIQVVADYFPRFVHTEFTVQNHSRRGESMATKKQTLMEAAIEMIFPSPDLANPVLLRCCKAWIRAHESALARGVNPVSAILRGNEAYRNSMPPLSGADNIRDYIACVAHGMVVRTILPEIGTRLLYAAQVALSACKAGNPKALGPRRQQKATPPPSLRTVETNITAEDPAA